MMIERVEQSYQAWKQFDLEDVDLKEELLEIEGDFEAIQDRFYRELAFGTAGLRGVLGAGTNRMNIYVVRKTTQAIADYLNGYFPKSAVAISYDSRIKSDVFAKEAARVLAANDIQVYLYEKLMPVPCLSYAVRKLHCQAGVMITASHNPAKYNGYKVYGADGCQITEQVANRILELSEKVDIFFGARLIDFETALAQGKIMYISQQTVQDYLDAVKKCCVHPQVLKEAGLKVVYTPLNGAGSEPVQNILKQMGVTEIHLVKEQTFPDGNFTTCPFPNPEIKEALALGLRDCQVHHPDILLATDPDCDRMGVAVPDKDGNYQLLTGNEVGALLLEYICKERKALGTLPKNPVAVKTIVSTDLARKICEEYGVELRNVLTGFKYIGEQIGILEAKGEADRFIFGFEESYGYLAGSYVRDKDGVVAALLICELTAFYRSKGMTVLEALQALYEKYGVYRHSTDSFMCEGASGMEKMTAIMEHMRTSYPQEIAGYRVETVSDYLSSQQRHLQTGETAAILLPKANVLEYQLENQARIILRPSGTEPKIKVYYTANGEDFAAASETEKKMKADFTKLLGF